MGAAARRDAGRVAEGLSLNRCQAALAALLGVAGVVTPSPAAAAGLTHFCQKFETGAGHRGAHVAVFSGLTAADPEPPAPAAVSGVTCYGYIGTALLEATVSAPGPVAAMAGALPAFAPGASVCGRGWVLYADTTFVTASSGCAWGEPHPPDPPDATCTPVFADGAAPGQQHVVVVAESDSTYAGATGLSVRCEVRSGSRSLVARGAQAGQAAVATAAGTLPAGPLYVCLEAAVLSYAGGYTTRDLGCRQSR